MKPGEVVENRFELERVAGSGGMGTVYRAIDRTTGSPVALKVLRSASVDAAQRFAREVRILSGLRHPGIVRYITDGRTHEGEMWLAMEWLEGESLSQRLGNGPLTPTEAVELVRRIAEALGAAHERGVIHRDLKPSNLFLTDCDLERVKVLDFGVARISDASATRTGIMIGTPGYMAPEQARGDRNVGARSDVFALGCLLFECLTGKPPFVGENVMAVLAKILLEDAPRVGAVRGDIPEALDDLVARTLSKSPDDRPRDGAHLAAELATISTLGASDRAAEAPAAALTSTERRLLCVVLIDGGQHEAIDMDATRQSVPSLDDTFPSDPGGSQPRDTVAESNRPELKSLREAAEAHGARLQRLVDGSLVVTLLGSGGTSDQAMQAARCAIALKAHLPPATPMALATGRGVMAGRWPVGEAIDRAATLLAAARKASPHLVRIDEVTAGLLDTSFDVGGDEAGLFLLGERDLIQATRTLLGKPTPCVGRDRELGVLHGLFEEALAEPMARAVLVTGAAGVGKSRLRYELVRWINQRNGEPVEIWIGRGDQLRSGSPFGMIAPALRRAAGILDGEPIEVRRQKLRARVMRHAGTDLARTTLFLGELVGVPFSDEESVELRAARQDTQLMADQVRFAFEHFLAVETSARPVVIVLEDLHWGDLPTTKLVDSALRALPDRPWFVVALARPEIHELFPRLWAERGLQELRLDELTKRGSEKLVRQVLGDRANDVLVARIVEQAGGNAFYLEELIRSVAEGKGKAADSIPETVLAVVQGRLERLEVDARSVLRAASVFGHQFWRGGVTKLLGGGARDSTVRSWLDELVERELVQRTPKTRFTGEDEYQFRHAMVREAAYAMLTDADRKLGHRLAGEWLHYAGETEAMVLAEHFERGGDRARAAVWYKPAVDQALAAGDFRGAANRAERGVACGATGETLGGLRRAQAEAHKWCGEFVEAERCAIAAMTLLLAGSAAWFSAAGEAAEASGKLGDVEQLSRIADLLARAPDLDNERAARVSALAHAAFQLYNNGRYQLAASLVDVIDRIADEVSDPRILARIHQTRSSRAMFAGDAGAYVVSEVAAANAFEAAGDLRYTCMQHGHVGYAYLEIGAYADAERWLRKALDGGTRMGLQNVVATAKHNLGRALLHQGRLDEAFTIESEAIAAFAAQGDRRLESASRSYLADILAARGDTGAAERELRLGLQTVQAASRPQALAALGQLLLQQGRAKEALIAAREAHDLLDSLGGVEEGESLVRLTYAMALDATGDRDAARTAIERARERVLERAAKITDPEWRASFLENLPENARTLAFARDVAGT